MHAAAAGQGRVGCIIETGTLQALALAAIGRGRPPSAFWRHAHVLGQPEGYVRVFADEGEPMRALLGRLASGQRLTRRRPRHPGRPIWPDPAGLRPEVGRIASRATAVPSLRGLRGLPGLPDPLTSREREVLGLLAQGRANRDIAAELVVTLDTVKRHVSHILAKLARSTGPRSPGPGN